MFCPSRQVEDLLMSFWKSLQQDTVMLLSLPDVCQLLKSYDVQLYKVGCSFQVLACVLSRSWHPVLGASQVALLVVTNLPASAGDAGEVGLIPGFRKISWRRKQQPTPILLPEKFHGQRSLAGCSPWSCRKVRHDCSDSACSHWG